jgi:hypothetical protein
MRATVKTVAVASGSRKIKGAASEDRWGTGAPVEEFEGSVKNFEGQ